MRLALIMALLLALAPMATALSTTYELRPDGTGEVRHLSSGILEAGRHTVTWDGRNDSGMTLGKGVYFLEVRDGVHGRQTLKVVRLAAQ